MHAISVLVYTYRHMLLTALSVQCTACMDAEWLCVGRMVTLL